MKIKLMDVTLSQDKKNLLTYLENELAEGRVERIMSIINDMQWRKVLDVGCGPGVLMNVLLRQSPDIMVGLDIDDEWLYFTKRKFGKNENVEFIGGSADHLPFKNCCFDLVICKVVLPYIPNEEEAIRGMCKCLSRGGILFLDLHSIGYYIYRIFKRKDLGIIYTTFSLFFGLIHQITGRKIFVAPDTYQSPSKIIRLLENQDMQILDISKRDRWAFTYKLFSIVARKRS